MSVEERTRMSSITCVTDPVTDLQTLSSRAVANTLLVCAESGPVTTASPWREQPWMSAKTFLHSRLPEPVLRMVYSELFKDDDRSPPPYTKLLSPIRAVLLTWLFVKPSPPPVASTDVSLTSAPQMWPPPPLFPSSSAAARMRPLREMPNPTMSLGFTNFTADYNVILARHLSEEEQRDSFHSLEFNCDKMPSAGCDALSAAVRNQPNLRKLRLLNLCCCGEAAFGSVCAEVSGPLRELAFSVNYIHNLPLPVPDVYRMLHRCLSRHSATLVTLELSFRNALASQIISEINACCPNLTKLSLTGCIPQGEQQQQQLTPSLSVTNLFLEYSDKPFVGYAVFFGFSNVDLSYISVAYPNLTQLRLKANFKVNADALVHLAALSHCLVELECQLDSQVGAGQVLQCCGNATKIRLYNYGVQPIFGGGEIFLSLPCLKDLDLSDMCDLKCEDIVTLLESCLSVERLSIHGRVWPRNFRFSALIRLLREKRVLRRLKELHLGLYGDRSMSSVPLLLELLALPDIESITGFGWGTLDEVGMQQVVYVAENRGMEVHQFDDDYDDFEYSEDED